MTEMISAIFFDEASIADIVVTTWPTTSAALRSDTVRADRELIGLACVLGILLHGGGQFSIDAAVSSRFAACVRCAATGRCCPRRSRLPPG